MGEGGGGAQHLGCWPLAIMSMLPGRHKLSVSNTNSVYGGCCRHLLIVYCTHRLVPSVENNSSNVCCGFAAVEPRPQHAGCCGTHKLQQQPARQTMNGVRIAEGLNGEW